MIEKLKQDFESTKQDLKSISINERIVIACLIVWILTDCILEGFSPVDPLNVSHQENQIEWLLDVISSFAQLATISLMIIFSLRSIRSKSFSWGRLSGVTMGIVYCLFCISFGIFGYYKSNSIEEVERTRCLERIRWSDSQLKKIEAAIDDKKYYPSAQIGIK